MHSEPAQLQLRLVRLERRTRLLGIAVITLAGFFLLAARSNSQAPDLIQAERVQLLDGDGRVRLDLRHDSSETGLFIMDEAGDIRVGAAQFAHGGGGFALHGASGKGGAILYLRGRGTLSIYDSTGTVTGRFPPEQP